MASFQLLPKIGRAEDGGAQMAGAGGGQQGFAVARVQHQMVDDMAQEMRPVGAPGLAGGVAMIDPGALAGGDQDELFLGLGAGAAFFGAFLAVFRNFVPFAAMTVP